MCKQAERMIKQVGHMINTDESGGRASSRSPRHVCNFSVNLKLFPNTNLKSTLFKIVTSN